MGSEEHMLSSLFKLPNELLLGIFDLLSTEDIIPLTPTCRQFHTLILRLIHNRLQNAAGLEGHELNLDCQPPASQLTPSKMQCTSLRTDGLPDLLSRICREEDYVGQVKSIFGIYSRFQVRRKDPEIRRIWRHPAVDIPGSRTHADSVAAPPPPAEVVSETVTVDAHDLFSQLSTSAYLIDRDSLRGLLYTPQDVSGGVIRVWRDWLSKQCESKRWTDGEPIIVHHDVPNSPTGNGKARADSVTGYTDPTKDPSILWINNGDNNFGIRMKVKEQKWINRPMFYTNDIEIPVSYQVDFEEVLVRTTHLLVKLEAAQKNIHDESGKAIVFGSFRA